MKKTALLLILAGLFFFCSCSSDKKTEETPANSQEVKTVMNTNDNPFLSDWDTPFKVPPFDKIKTEHFVPAMEASIKRQEAEIDAIIQNNEPPTFANTIEALDKSGSLYRTVDQTFSMYQASLNDEKIQEAAQVIAKLDTQHRDNIKLNEKLFARIKAVYDQKDSLNLTVEQNMLLKEFYNEFVRGGANLAPEQKERFKKINEELASLELTFGDHVLAETNKYKLVIDKKEDLAGLPEAVISAAAEAAKENGLEGKWVFTIHKPSLIPFLQFSEKRELREQMFKAYIMKGDHNDDLDNKAVILKMVNLRTERAKMLGFKSHAHYKLDDNMAKTPEAVYKFLNQLWEPALKRAKAEVVELQDLITKEGKDFKLEPWDWWYYAEKLKKVKYDLDDEVLRPYFQLENVRDGAFEVATRIFGIKFLERTDIPVYHKDVKVFEVKDADDSHVGILYVDYFPRSSKRSGAWMSALRRQSNWDGQMVRPVVTNKGNFSKPTGDKPALLSFDEVGTLFHEFGHALHGLLSQCTYEKLSGTAVPIDFVELPSQIMENWAFNPEVLKIYAKNYKTGDIIPQDLIDKIKNAGLFNQGFNTVEYLAACFLDLDWYTLESVEGIEVNDFETKMMNKIALIPEIVPRYRSTYFQHVFASQYSAGYYSYIWAEVLDADAFEAFKEHGVFDKATGMSFRKNILEKGGTDDAMELYKRFRGAEPKVEPLLEKRGLK